MIKKLIYPLAVFTLVIALSACSTLQLSTAQSASSLALQNIVGQTVKNKLAVGMLKLEGTDLSITADQVKELLPLWQAVKSLNGQKTTAAEEMAALYDQIQASMTTEQIQYIDKLDLTATDLDDLAQKYVLHNDQTSQNQAITSSTTSTGGGPQGGVPGLDAPPDAGMGGLTSGGSQSAQTTTTPQTPAAAQSSSTSLAASNITFASAVINLLQQRSGS
jgi:hypothetical protein